MRVFKYQLEVTNIQTIEMPDFSEILTVQMQNGHPCLWALVDDSNPLPIVSRIIRTYGTGHPIERPTPKYIGTYQIGEFVSHVFEEKETS